MLLYNWAQGTSSMQQLPFYLSMIPWYSLVFLKHVIDRWSLTKKTEFYRCYIYIYIFTLLLSNTSMVLKKDSYLIIPIRCNSCCLKWVLIRTLFVSWHFLLWLEPGSILKNILSMKCLLREFRRCKDQTLFPVWFRYEVWLAK